MIRFEPIPQPKLCMPPRIVRSLEERMADDMRELHFSDRPVNEETLIERGWTKPTIKRLAPTATEIARRKSIRQVSA
ncbi:hypothetical protein ABK249_02860 [Neorhizobium sp. Rsf11]|uniref:Uncharacterized protein n=1 Tax=Neorhizobium phenanthreniclasticum TaxID=3157917 RepID=A0ABV0LWP2_9HYPH